MSWVIGWKVCEILVVVGGGRVCDVVGIIDAGDVRVSIGCFVFCGEVLCAGTKRSGGMG